MPSNTYEILDDRPSSARCVVVETIAIDVFRLSGLDNRTQRPVPKLMPDSSRVFFCSTPGPSLRVASRRIKATNESTWPGNVVFTYAPKALRVSSTHRSSKYSLHGRTTTAAFWA